jgi:hypothetical protein
MKQVSYFLSDDGTKFDTEHECQQYEALSGTKNTIYKWCEHKFGDKQGQATNALNKIMKWEMDRAEVLGHSYVYPEVPVQDDEPAIPKAEAA